MRGDDQIVPYADSGSVERKAAEERYLEDLEGLSAGHADDAGRLHQVNRSLSLEHRRWVLVEVADAMRISRL